MTSYWCSSRHSSVEAPPQQQPCFEGNEDQPLLSEQSPLVTRNAQRSERRSQGHRGTAARWKFGLALSVLLCLLSAAYLAATRTGFSSVLSFSSSVDPPLTEEEPLLRSKRAESTAYHLPVEEGSQYAQKAIPYELWEAWKEQDLLKISKQRGTSTPPPPPPPPPQDASESDGSSSASPAFDWLHQTWNSTATTARDAWERLQGGSGRAEQAAGKWWGRSERSATQWWNGTQQGAEEWWDGTERGAERWWNRTVRSEREWQDATSSQLRTFGSRVRSWWNSTAAATQSKERVLQSNFANWWKRAGEADRRWWNDTVEAFGRFEHSSLDRTAAWWNWTRGAASDGWQAGVETEEEWWNATQSWFVNHTHSAKSNAFQDGRELLYFNSTRAFQMLTAPYGWFDQSSHFFYLQQGWEAQINQAYCGVASAAAVFNSFGCVLQSDLPLDPSYNPYRFATQLALVRDSCTSQHVVRVDDAFDGILSFPGGLSLDQVGRLLRCFLAPSWNVSVVHVTPAQSLDAVSRDLIGALHDPSSRVLVNFHRQALGQVGGGHFSPLGAYHVPERKVLVMDVAKYKYPPVWVPVEQLYLAMRTLDRCGSHIFPTHRWQDAVLINVTQAYRSNASQHHLEKLLQQASDLLDCQPSYRGYIVVRQGL